MSLSRSSNSRMALMESALQGVQAPTDSKDSAVLLLCMLNMMNEIAFRILFIG